MQFTKRSLQLVSLILWIQLPLFSFAENPFAPHDYFRLRTIVEAVMSPDGEKIVFSMNINREMEAGKGNDYRELYVKNLKTGDISPLLTGKHYFTSLQWRPGTDMVSVLGKFNQVENNQVFGIALNSDSLVQLTDHITGIRSYAWNPMENGLAFTALEEVKEDSAPLKSMGFDAEVYEEGIRNIDLYWQRNGTLTKVNQEGCVFEFSWSPEGNVIAAQIAPLNLVDHSYMFKRIYLIDPEKGSQEKIVDNPGKLSHMAWSPDNRHLAFVAGVDRSDPVDGSLFVVDTRTPVAWEELKNYTLDMELSVSGIGWLDKNTIIYSADESVDVTLTTMELGKGQPKILYQGGEVVFTGFSTGKDHLCMKANTASHPDELYTFDLKKNRFQRETYSNDFLENIEFGKQEKISWEARDGLRIDGVLIYPVDYEPGKRYPLINYIHGGPESCVRNGWSTSYSTYGQIAAGQGYFVLMPNYRASSGRGVAYSKMDHKDLGDEEFLDVIDGIEFLANKGFIDKTKVGIGGGSYGGYFSALAATKYSEHFAAAIPFVGVTNQLSKVNLTDIPYEIHDVHWTIWPNEDPELFYDRSPVKYSTNNRTATLILHGKEDTRVHPSQSLELYRQLKLNGKAPVRLVLYPDEGHGNRNNQAQLDFMLRTMGWFGHYLKGEGNKDELPDMNVNYQLEKLGDINLDSD